MQPGQAEASGLVFPMPKRPAPSIPAEAEILAGFLEALDAAGVAGLPLSKLVKGGVALKQARSAALQRLEQSGLAVEHRIGAKAHWFAVRHEPGAGAALKWLRDKGMPRGLVAWTAADFKRLLPPALKVFAMEAAASLAQTGELCELRAASGKSRYWFFAKTLPFHPHAILEMPEVPDASRNPSTQRLVLVGPAALAAYTRWRQSSGSSLMAISDLVREANLPLRALHEWLLEEAKARRAELSEGDWTLATEEMREAALQVQGMKFIRVRFEETG